MGLAPDFLGYWSCMQSNASHTYYCLASKKQLQNIIQMIAIFEYGGILSLSLSLSAPHHLLLSSFSSFSSFSQAEWFNNQSGTSTTWLSLVVLWSSGKLVSLLWFSLSSQVYVDAAAFPWDFSFLHCDPSREWTVPALAFSLKGIKESPFAEITKSGHGPNGKWGCDAAWTEFLLDLLDHVLIVPLRHLEYGREWPGTRLSELAPVLSLADATSYPWSIAARQLTHTSHCQG